MGIYHLMGLGLYIGAITSPLVYVAGRVQSAKEADRAFLRRQVTAETLNSDFQTRALILFTTRDVLAGQSERSKTYGYTLNPHVKLPTKEQIGEGKITPEIKGWGAPGRELLQMALTDISNEVKAIFSAKQEHEVYWCICPFDDWLVAFERMSLVLATLNEEAGRSHHIWACANGGPDTISSPLQLAFNLSSFPVRLYTRLQKDNLYALVQNKENFWFDLPPLALGFSEMNRRLKLYVEKYLEPDSATMNEDGDFHKKLGEAFVRFFSRADLEQLCFEMNIDEEEFLGNDDTKIDFARKLILFCENRGQLANLVIHARKSRTEIPWGDHVVPDQSPEWLLMSVVAQYGKDGVERGMAYKQLQGIFKSDEAKFDKLLIEPMLARGYLVCNDDKLREGPEWANSSAYFKAQVTAQRDAEETLDKLVEKQEQWAESERWFYKQAITL